MIVCFVYDKSWGGGGEGKEYLCSFSFFSLFLFLLSSVIQEDLGVCRYGVVMVMVVVVILIGDGQANKMFARSAEGDICTCFPMYLLGFPQW